MDLAEFKAKLAASREFEVEEEGAKFRLRLPSEHAWRVSSDQYRGKQSLIARDLVEHALIGWSGVKQKLISPGIGGDEGVPFSPDAKALLLDERQDIADKLMISLMERLNARRAEIEAARKN